MSDDRMIVQDTTATEAEEFVKIAEANSELMSQLHVYMPYRASTGVDPRLLNMMYSWQQVGISAEPFRDYGGGFLEVLRARMAYTFLHEMKDKKYLMMIDDDMIPSLDLPWKLIRHEKPVVSGVAVAFHQEHGPMACFTRKDKEGNWRFPSVRHGHQIPKKGLIKVGHVGTGAVCIRRDVLEAFSWESDDVPFYVRESIRRKGACTGQLTRGEDIEFCWQARSKGFDIFVDLEAHVGHVKPMVLEWPGTHVNPYMEPDDLILEPRGLKIGMEYET